MSFAAIIYYFFAGFTVLCGLGIVLTRNVLYAAVFLLGTLLGVAALYVFAGADFVAITQIAVYIGGILILIIFGIMLSNRVKNIPMIVTETRNRFWGFLIGIFAFIALVFTGWQAGLESFPGVNESMIRDTTVPELGINMMTWYILPFELAAILLLVALIGAAMIARRDLSGNAENNQEPEKEEGK